MSDNSNEPHGRGHTPGLYPVDITDDPGTEVSAREMELMAKAAAARKQAGSDLADEKVDAYLRSRGRGDLSRRRSASLQDAATRSTGLPEGVVTFRDRNSNAITVAEASTMDDAVVVIGERSLRVADAIKHGLIVNTEDDGPVLTAAGAAYGGVDVRAVHEERTKGDNLGRHLGSEAERVLTDKSPQQLGALLRVLNGAMEARGEWAVKDEHARAVGFEPAEAQAVVVAIAQRIGGEVSPEELPAFREFVLSDPRHRGRAVQAAVLGDEALMSDVVRNFRNERQWTREEDIER